MYKLAHLSYDELRNENSSQIMVEQEEKSMHSLHYDIIRILTIGLFLKYFFGEITFHSFKALIFYLAAYEIYIEKGSECQNPLIFSTQINLDIIENIFGIST